MNRILASAAIPALALALTLGFAGSPSFAKDAAPTLDFELADANGKTHKLSDFKGKWVVLEWMNYDCPFVKKHYDESVKNMQALQKKYTDKGVIWLSICSSAPGLQGHLTGAQALEAMKARGAVPTALLLDPTGKAGKTFEAKVTPDMRIVDPNGAVVYSGAIDSVRSKRPEDVKGATNYIAQVLDAALEGKAVEATSNRPYG